MVGYMQKYNTQDMLSLINLFSTDINYVVQCAPVFKGSLSQDIKSQSD